MMKLSELTTLLVVAGALVLVGLDKMDLETLLALLGGVMLRRPLVDRPKEGQVVD